VVRARIANHVDEFLELERRLPVRKLADVLVACGALERGGCGVSVLPV